MGRLNYYNPNITFDRKALKEVWVILNEYGEDKNKIPQNQLYLVEDNMDKDYDFVLDISDTSVLHEDTKKLITYFYTNYLSTPEERKVLKELEEIQYKEKQEREKSEKAQHELEKDTRYEEQGSIFDKLNLEEEMEKDKQQESYEKISNLPIEQKESPIKNVFNKIKEFIKNIFNK